MLYFSETTELAPVEFYRLVRAHDQDGTAPCAVTCDACGIPNRHRWPDNGDPNIFLARVTSGERGAYYTPASFRSEASGGQYRRGKRYVAACRALWVDIEGNTAKGGYEGHGAVVEAANAFIEQTGLEPTVAVKTGSGGLHLYYVPSCNLDPSVWRALADALVATCRAHGLKIDEPVTTDASRILRAPGSIHQKTGRIVRAYHTGALYAVDVLERRLGCGVGATQRTRSASAASQDVLGGTEGIRHHRPFSMLEAAKHCAAIRQAIADRGRNTPYQPWILALRTAALSVEGVRLAHAISDGHPDYDPAETEAKLASLTGGPPRCETWHRSWGDKSPCPNCQYWEGDQ